MRGAINGSQFLDDYKAPEIEFEDEDEEETKLRDRQIEEMPDDAETIILKFANKQETRVYEKTNQITRTGLSYKKVKLECFDTLYIPAGFLAKLSQKI
jgi:hypothetical protein